MIYLIRHGQTDWNLEKKTQGHTDISLNENGKEQAKLVSRIISNYKIDKIYSSDLLRAKETAEIINENFGLNIILDNRLREINYGDLEGVPRPTLSQDVWDVFNNNPEKLNAEPIISVFNRIKSFFEISLYKSLITSALKRDWAREIKKKGEKSVPPMREAAAAFKIESTMKEAKSISRAARITVFAKPSLKKGTMRGKIISAYEKRSVSAQR